MKRSGLPEDLKKTIAFHGHLCPGLLIGYRAAKAALKRLQAKRSADEELIALVENNSCSVDAVQFLTGSTFGKGNLFFLDHGKQVFTFARRPSGKKKRPRAKAVRVSLKPAAFGPESPSREERITRLLSAPDSSLFTIQEKIITLPPEAEIKKSVICAKCGEPVMETRTVKKGKTLFCIPCATEKTKA